MPNTTENSKVNQIQLNNDLLDMKELEGLSEKEKEEVLKILSEISNSGSSSQYESFLYEDYKEIPVDIETFLTDDRYLGKAWKEATGKSKVYAFWMDVLKQLFPTNIDTAYNTLLESGARGIGKSEVACGAVGAYLMYRVMCMKNPLEFYHLKPTEKICFAFMNIKLDLAEEIAISKFQNTIQTSDWFMSKGTLTKRNNKPYWNPPDPIAVIIGSQSDDVIGQPIYFCLDEDTVILTEHGDRRLGDLVGSNIRVPSISDNGDVVLSDLCTVQPTAVTNIEYEIMLEDDSVIRCTPEHRFMLKDGSYKEAQYLTLQDELFDIEPYGYVYKITNTITCKSYIGKREKSKFDKSYWGSGKYITNAIKKYGTQNFDREVLCWALTKEDLNNLEKYYIAKFDTITPKGYNIASGGQGGSGPHSQEWISAHSGPGNGRFGKPVSESTKQKISQANLGRVRSEEFKQKVSQKLKGVQKPEGFTQKVSNYHKGKVVCNNGVVEKHLPKGSTLPDGFVIGSLRHDVRTCNGTKIYNNGVSEIRVKPGDEIPEGFVLGRVLKGRKTYKNNVQNRRWYNNGEIEVYITHEPDDGFVVGRLKGRKRK